MLTHFRQDHPRFAIYSHVDDPPYSPNREYEFRHLQARSHIILPRASLTVEITNYFQFCDKFCQILYKSVPIFMSFSRFELCFLVFQFSLTFCWFVLFIILNELRNLRCLTVILSDSKEFYIPHTPLLIRERTGVVFSKKYCTYNIMSYPTFRHQQKSKNQTSKLPYLSVFS